MPDLVLPRAVESTSDGLAVNEAFCLMLDRESLDTLRGIFYEYDRRGNGEPNMIRRARWDPEFAVWFAVAKLLAAVGDDTLLKELISELTPEGS